MLAAGALPWLLPTYFSFVAPDTGSCLSMKMGGATPLSNFVLISHMLGGKLGAE